MCLIQVNKLQKVKFSKLFKCSLQKSIKHYPILLFKNCLLRTITIIPTTLCLLNNNQHLLTKNGYTSLMLIEIEIKLKNVHITPVLSYLKETKLRK